MRPSPSNWKRLFRALINLSAALFLLQILLLTSPLVPWLNRMLVTDWADPEGDVLVVLGGGMLDDNYIDASSLWRATTALRAWRAGNFSLVIVSGGDGDPAPPSVAGQIARLLVLEGVPEDRIRIEEQSSSTRENALFTKPLIPAGATGIVVVTSDFHTYRAKQAFAKVGVPVRVHPHADIGKHWNTFLARPSCLFTVAGEYAKIAYYRYKGWI